MGQTLPLFCLFSFFSQCKDKYTTIRMCDYKWKKRRWCAWYSNPGRHMEGANKSTELWRHPPQDIGLFKQKLQFLHQKYVKNVHPVYGAGIRTHYLRNVSLFPKPLDQDSRPGYCTLYSNFD